MGGEPVKNMLLVVFACAVALMGGAGPAAADPDPPYGFFNNSGSCSGSAENWGSFYAWTSSQVFIYSDGRVEDTSHNFSFDGFLDGAENAAMLYSKDYTWLVFRAGDFDIAVPYVKGAGLWAQDNRYGGGWTKLCSY